MTKTLTVTLGQIIQAEPALARLARKELPLRLALHVARIYRAIEAEYRAFEERRVALIRRLGRASADGRRWDVTPENEAAFAREITEAVAVAVDVDGEPLKWRDLEAVEHLRLSAEDLVLLEPLMEAREESTR